MAAFSIERGLHAFQILQGVFFGGNDELRHFALAFIGHIRTANLVHNEANRPCERGFLAQIGPRDNRARRNARARALVPGITFTISGPLVVLALLPGIFGWDITVPLVLMLGLVATQGLAQGSLDATLMPVLRSHIDERYSATGYGLLNLTSAGVGALISFFGGWFKDQGVPLTTTLAAAGCLMLFCGLLLLMLPRPKH